MSVKLRHRGAVAACALIGLSACSGGGGGGGNGSGGGSAPPPPPPPAPTGLFIEDRAEANVFLTRATFGPTLQEMDALNGADASAWFQNQLSMPVNTLLDDMIALDAADELNSKSANRLAFTRMINADDQLRQRMAFALSQIVVVSDIGGANGNDSLMFAYYLDILQNNAFGNYRDLLEEITYSPSMGHYLTYLKNPKGDMEKGRVPDENYAREIMQLFTIGLIELNQDGTPRLGANGNEIETYDNDDVAGLARVFTGLSYQGEHFYYGHDDDAESKPMVVFPDFHSELEKSFLGETIPAGTSGEESIDRALDILFEHPNTAPFVSRQLIQRFTTSNPSPAYVRRVADAFDAGRFELPNGDFVGEGRRGDLTATLAAVLFDAEVTDLDAVPDADDGKIREPVIRFVHFARAYDMQPAVVENDWWLHNTSDLTRLAQHPFRSPSVFNFYRPGFVAPQTATGDAGLTAPELQIVNAASAVGYANFMARYARDNTPSRDGVASFVPDYTEEMAIADDPEALVDLVSEKLTGGRLNPVTRDRIVETISLLRVRDNTEDNTRKDLERRVETAVFMVTTSPAFDVQN